MAGEIQVRTGGILGFVKAVCSTSIQQLTDEQVIDLWSVFDLLEKQVIADKKDELRTRLLALAQKIGEKTVKGHFVCIFNGAKITDQKSNKVAFDTMRLLQLLKLRNIEPEAAGTWKFAADEKKLEGLVGSGRISLEELKGCSTLTTIDTLKVQKDPELEKAFMDVLPKQGISTDTPLNLE